MSILELFCSVDDFRQQFARTWQQDLLTSGQRHRVRPTQLHPSEIMTILILFHQSHDRTFKAYCTEYVQRHLHSEFPTLVSYQRFVELMPMVLVPLVAYPHTLMGQCTGISCIDSTPLAVCHNARIHSHRVFDGRAAGGKTSVGWFYGFKLHLVVTQGLQLITKLRKNMHNRLLDWSDKLLLRKRAIIETITDQLKNISQIEHSRHRSPINFLVNLIAGLIAHCHQPKKPSLGVQLPTLKQG
jgi:hypothetical protein